MGDGGGDLHESVGLEDDGPEVRALDAVLQRSLAKDRDGRFATVGEMKARQVRRVGQVGDTTTG